MKDRTLGIVKGFWAGAGLLIASWPAAASACAVCYGEPDSPTAHGLTWAIMALGAIVVCVLAGVVGFFVQANRKAAELSAEDQTGRPE